MALAAWINEESVLYLAGEDNGHDAKTAGIPEVLEAANKHLTEAGEYKLLDRGDAGRFRTLWVHPEAFDQEYWDDAQWADAWTVEEDVEFGNKGWVPVLSVELESAA